MFRFLSKAFGYRAKLPAVKKATSRRKRSTVLAVERLETRLMPIVGAFGPAAVVGAGAGYDGVVRISGPAGNCTGTLLSTGRHILTAAHCVDFDLDTDGDGVPDRGNGTVDAGTYTVRFDMPWSTIPYTVPAANISVPTGNFNGLGNWNGNWTNGRDIAVMRLNQVAPLGAQRFFPYTGTDEVGRWAYIVGYGRWGQGDTSGPIDRDGDGIGESTGCDNMARNGLKRIGANFFDDTDAPNDTRLKLDFDSDTSQWTGSSDPTTSTDWENEVDTAPGDSGGPSFLWGGTGLEIAAVTSGGTVGSCLGGNSTYTRVSPWSGWINQQMAGSYQLVIDMSQQPGSGNGGLDTITLNAGGTILTVQIGGQPVVAANVSELTSIQLLGSSDQDRFELFLRNLPLTVTVDGRGGSDEVVLSCRSAAAPTDSATVNGTSAIFNGTTVSISTFSNVPSVEAMTLDLFDGIDSVTVNWTASGLPVTVNGGNDNDTITVGPDLGALWSALVVNGDGHTDTLNLSDAAYGGGDTYRLQNQRISINGLPAVTLTYSSINILSLTTGAGPDTVIFDGMAAGIATTITMGMGANSLTGPNATTTWNLTGAGSGTFTANVTTYTFSGAVNLTGGNLADRFVYGLSGSFTGVIDGGDGNDTLVGPGRANTWTINASNGGNLNGVGSFARIENLTGGSLGNRFAFNRGFGVTGTISGGSGADWLDYAAYHTYNPWTLQPIPANVTVNLTTGTASGAGSVGSIEHVRGGLGNDSITGSSANNILVGGAGNDSLVGNNGRDVIIGGDGADSSNGGVGDDLLIAGWTSYDTNLDALLAIMTEWGRTNANSGYGQRITNLRNGVLASDGTTVRLVQNTTVFDDMFVDTLTGGNDMDWFWAQDQFVLQSPFLPPSPPRDTMTDQLTSLNPELIN